MINAVTKANAILIGNDKTTSRVVLYGTPHGNMWGLYWPVLVVKQM
jgi:hypothetical protein